MAAVSDNHGAVSAAGGGEPLASSRSVQADGLPEWLQPLYTADEMRAADAFTIEVAGVPSLDLMERAGAGLARVCADVAGDGPIRIVIGKGNNAGDGLVCARLLRAEGREVDVLAVSDPAELRGDARVNLERLPGEPPRPFESAALAGSGLVCDALLGTGARGAPREPYAAAIAAINASGAPVVACDIPSGVDASTGETPGVAVRATATATFHRSKVGLHVMPGAEHAGEVIEVEIGIDRAAPPAQQCGLVSDAVAGLYPPRKRSGHKFASGVVLVVGGARGLTGAPVLAALAAQRAGAGYVQVAVPASVREVVDARLLEQMCIGLPESDGGHDTASVGAVAELARRAGCVALGPGLGRSERAREFARELAATLERPLVLDADGLNAFAGRLGELAGRPAATVLTPHEGELARLLDTTVDEVRRRRLHSARLAAAKAQAVCVLKGDDTLVALPDGRVAVSAGGSPALATAGTGDVLTGLVAALVARGMDPFAAACFGVLAHARAGAGAAQRLGADHVVARDVIEALPAAIAGPGGPAPRAAVGGPRFPRRLG
ncbi:NAD(P)H-hydrate dehydratase [Thermoleophilum album]|uniref:NAD(P)H-hydrate dehydratase n=1 Tax=Thermoleophilum album TaxID=29539 RepID=UPI00237D1B78|nr:NAD(P)H-hydrate dehydratase [Thermoleophilum album]WDT93093.1 NAD(P)H-hydrate dehydratase [Thermoleophilum album]